MKRLSDYLYCFNYDYKENAFECNYIDKYIRIINTKINKLPYVPSYLLNRLEFTKKELLEKIIAKIIEPLKKEEPTVKDLMKGLLLSLQKDGLTDNYYRKYNQYKKTLNYKEKEVFKEKIINKLEDFIKNM